jgi:DNA invertase Pin-like site-specific DNA recombinase
MGRPALAEVLEFVRTGDTLVVWRLDRLARSVADLIAIIKGLEVKGVAFVSLTEGIDTKSGAGGSCSISSPPWPNSSES